MPGRSGLFLPDAKLRSLTAVAGAADIRTRIVEVKLSELEYFWRPPRSQFQELAVKRIAARCEPQDSNNRVRIMVNGKLYGEFSLGLLHDAYDGKGVHGSQDPARAEQIIGEFGKILAKVDAAIDRLSAGPYKMPDGRVGLNQATPEEKMQLLGRSMQALADAIEQMRTGRSLGVPLKDVLVGRQDDFSIELSDKMQGTARVYLYCLEKIDSR